MRRLTKGIRQEAMTIAVNKAEIAAAEEKVIDDMHALVHGGGSETTFHISYNFSIRRVPDAIKCLKPFLQILHIDNNFELAHLPASIGDLTQLRWLNVSYNKLTSLPREVGKLRALERLHCSNNHLESLPLELWGLRELNELRCETNRIRALPGGLLFLKKLVDVQTEGNPLLTASDLDGADAADVVDKIEDGGDCANCRVRFTTPVVFASFHTLANGGPRPFAHYVCAPSCESQLKSRLAARDAEVAEEASRQSSTAAATILANSPTKAARA